MRLFTEGINFVPIFFGIHREQSKNEVVFIQLLAPGIHPNKNFRNLFFTCGTINIQYRNRIFFQSQ